MTDRPHPATQWHEFAGDDGGWATEPDACPHCGVRNDPWWSRTEPMGYFCQHCGNNWDELPAP